MQFLKFKKNQKAIIDYAQLISEISDQVGLFSLNASIESARAGEIRKGFQVVKRNFKTWEKNKNKTQR